MKIGDGQRVVQLSVFFETDDAFASVRHDPEFVAVVNAPVVSQ